ncbi:hypothetical protein HYT58_03090 [Candidatus Woesearchaeota archaeon]|nr:hypothetical protein [Candidatus Woesearchaeota archaeon]
MLAESTKSFRITGSLVRDFVGITKDPNPMHTDTRLARAVFEKVNGREKLESALREAGDYPVIVPGALLIQYVEPEIKKVCELNNLSLERVIQSYQFLKTGLIGNKEKYYGLKVGVFTSNGNRRQYEIRVQIRLGEELHILGRSEALQSSPQMPKTPRRIGRPLTYSKELTTEEALQSSPQMPKTPRRIGRPLTYSKELTTEAVSLNLDYWKLLGLTQPDGEPLEFWPTRIISALPRGILTSQNPILFYSQVFERDPSVNGQEKIMCIGELPIRERFKEGVVQGLERTIRTIVISGKKVSLFSESKGLELAI